MVTLVEIDESEFQSPQEDRFQELVKEFLDAIEQDGQLNEMTAEMYDQKKFDLIEQLIELSHLHKVLPGQHVGSSDSSSLQLVKFCAPRYRTSIGYDVQLTPRRDDSGVGFILLSFLMSKISDLEEEIVSLNKKLQSSGDVITKLRHKIEEKASNTQSKQNYINTQKSRIEAEKANVKRLKNQIADLNAVIAVNNVRAEEFREEVKKCKAKNKEIDELRLRVLIEKASEKEAYNKEISKLNAREVNRNGVIGRLEQALEEKSDKFDALMLEKDGVKAQLETLLAEKCSLQAERVGAALSFENVEKLTNELKLKLAELETEVERQKNVI